MKSIVFMQVYAQLFKKEMTTNTLTHNLTAKKLAFHLKIDTKPHSLAK